MFVEGEEVVDVADSKDAAGEEPDDSGADLAQIEAVDAEGAEEGLEDPGDIVVDAARLVAEVAFLIHGGDEEEVDEPADAKQARCEKPDHAGDRLAVVEAMGSGETEDPENVANGFRVGVSGHRR